MGFLFHLLLALGLQTLGIRVEGTILDGDTGKPLASVSVQLAGRRVSTDLQGHFSFIAVPPGRYPLLADKDGYMRARADGRRIPGNSGIDVTVGSGKQDPLILHMFKGGSVTGRIYDSKGVPLRNIAVVPYRQTYDDAGNHRLRRVPISVQTSTPDALIRTLLGLTQTMPSLSPGTTAVMGSRTNDLGEFRIYNLDPGEYAFFIDAGPPNLPLYYPGVANAPDAAMVNVPGGMELRLNNVTLPSSNEAILRVKFISPAEERSFATAVEIHRKGAEETIATSSVLTAGQQMAIKLPPGAYDVDVFGGTSALRGPSPYFAAQRVPVVMAGQDVEITVPLRSGPGLTGSVMTEATAAIPPRPISGVQFTLRSADIIPDISMPMTSGPGGDLFMRSVPAATYKVTAVSGIPSGMCMTSIRTGDRNVLKDGLQVAGSDVRMDVLLSAAAAMIKGTVTDSRNLTIAGATVALVPDDPARSDLFAAGTTDQLGGFELPCIQQGDYRLYAWAEVDGYAYRNAEFMKAYSDGGRAIRVEKAQNATVNLRLLENK